MNKKELHTKMKKEKQRLVNTFDEKVLPNVKATKEELEDVRKQFKEQGVSEDRMDMALADYNIRKQLNIINREADLHAELDKAIGFLGSLLAKDRVQ